MHLMSHLRINFITYQPLINGDIFLNNIVLNIIQNNTNFLAHSRTKYNKIEMQSN